MDLKEIGFEYLDWIHVTQDMDQWPTLVNTTFLLLLLLHALRLLKSVSSTNTAYEAVNFLIR